ncbi:glutamate-1-semialdehyde 2,1-aminomutase [Candidatus Kryptobacter tengchongensis]|uniref:Glutamate-1-semialdehyde 2,1-aminomutase n=1 Tax=Kryptobacter tengchongensis TaxID=1643429 RepID=A0A656D334_KRYT1|nr:glutamate-1-semialdehyde 2,1-aminomutase [Candidatus Kryptobacter tengchongensis]CUS96638.1 glutamate-1-semialdehyde 2,1-aminomutase [Candidatus Kryptobacter tengchongensis]
MKKTKSKTLYTKAQSLIPGGVNSPVRAFKSVNSTPLFISKASGSKIWDVDGNKFIDYVMSWGPLILGHSHPEVISAVKGILKNGTSYGAPTEIEVKMAELINKMMPTVELVRMVNSGTEATMSAIRLARAYTGRKKIIKFEGCYHGHADSFLVKAGSGATTLGIPSSPGVPDEIASLTLNARYNDVKSVEKLIEENKNEIACIIVEPVAGNMGVVPPKDGFLEKLRQICDRENILLVFDEVITGFRLAPGGAQEYFGVKADLTTLGKIIGGGFPVGAYGGRKEIMELVAPSGPVYQAGTLSGNPIAMTAGYTTLKILYENRKTFYKRLESKARTLAESFKKIANKNGVKVQINQIGSMLTVFFNDGEVYDYDSALRSDTRKFARFFNLMLENGIYLPPSQFEAMFLSSAHTDEDIEKTIDAFEKVILKL